MPNPFMGYDQWIPLLAPVDLVAVNTTTYVDLRNAQHVSFLIAFGLITSATATEEFVITVQCASAVDAAEATVEYRYQVAAAVGTHTWGDVTSVGATGHVMHVDTDDGFWVLVTLDVGLLATSDYRYARVVLTPSDTDLEAGLTAIMAILETRYKQDDHISATADASA